MVRASAVIDHATPEDRRRQNVIASRGPVVHVSTARTWRGGEQQLLNLARGLLDRQIDTVVIAQPDSPVLLRCKEAGIRVAAVRCRGELDMLAVGRIARLIQRENGSLLHAHDAHAVTLAAIASRIAGIPRVCTRRVDFVPRSRWKYRRGMDHVICVSHAVERICADAGVPRHHMTVVHSGIDLSRLKRASGDRNRSRSEFVGQQTDRPIVLNVASLADHKDQRCLLDAIPHVLGEIPEVVLVIVGEGELERPLRRQVARLNLERHCIFAGHRNDVPDLLNACDLLAASSYMEGLCTSVMDAMAAGKAVVSTNAGGLPELVEEGITGLLVPPRDPKALGRAIVTLLQDHDRRAAFGRAAAERAQMWFGLDHMVNGTVDVYSQILSG